ncbi:hypothetical protein [Gymnodinialimonas hymeniacidonis]|uniref:hypothetical protein n=1 Tax=Gymnodinialimonas hymeniacidonis TaxID=3126508 RepID=UPI0034C6B619
MKHVFLIAALVASGPALANTYLDTIVDGLPPVVAETPMVVEVLAEPGGCMVHPLADLAECYRVRMPDGSTQDHFIEGFDGNGPARLHVNRLTYDWSQNTLSHPVVPGFSLIERLD